MIEFGHTIDTLIFSVLVLGALGFMVLGAAKLYVAIKIKERDLLIVIAQNMNRLAIEVEQVARALEKRNDD